MRDDCVFLKDILDQIEIIESGSDITSYEEFCASHKETPVSLLAKTRDKLVHGYQGTDYKQVWKMITEDVPELKRIVEGILADLQ